MDAIDALLVRKGSSTPPVAVEAPLATAAGPALRATWWQKRAPWRRGNRAVSTCVLGIALFAGAAFGPWGAVESRNCLFGCGAWYDDGLATLPARHALGFIFAFGAAGTLAVVTGSRARWVAIAAGGLAGLWLFMLVQIGVSSFVLFGSSRITTPLWAMGAWMAGCALMLIGIFSAAAAAQRRRMAAGASNANNRPLSPTSK
jgi:hypothetical protein